MGSHVSPRAGALAIDPARAGDGDVLGIGNPVAAYGTGRSRKRLRPFSCSGCYDRVMISPTRDDIPPVPPRRGLHRHLYAQVLAAIVLGVLVGHFYPNFGIALKPLGDAFINLVKMIIAPVIFLTMVTGIAGMRELGSVGRVVGKAFVYFLFFSTLALIIGDDRRQCRPARCRHERNRRLARCARRRGI
jgi:hypothetical protein